MAKRDRNPLWNVPTEELVEKLLNMKNNLHLVIEINRGDERAPGVLSVKNLIKEYEKEIDSRKKK